MIFDERGSCVPREGGCAVYIVRVLELLVDQFHHFYGVVSGPLTGLGDLIVFADWIPQNAMSPVIWVTMSSGLVVG